MIRFGGLIKFILINGWDGRILQKFWFINLC